MGYRTDRQALCGAVRPRAVRGRAEGAQMNLFEEVDNGLDGLGKLHALFRWSWDGLQE